MSKKIVIKPARVKIHSDLERFLKQKGYQFIAVLVNPPATANQEELIYLVTEELRTSSFDPKDGDLTAVIGGMGIGSQWIAVLEAVQAKLPNPPYVIMPRYEGREAQFTCWLGEKTVTLP